MRIVRELDAGPVAGVGEGPVGPLDTAAEVEAKLAARGGRRSCARALPLLARGRACLSRAGSRQGELLPAAGQGRRRPRLLVRRQPCSPPGSTGSTRGQAAAVEIGGAQVKLGLADRARRAAPARSRARSWAPTAAACSSAAAHGRPSHAPAPAAREGGCSLRPRISPGFPGRGRAPSFPRGRCRRSWPRSRSGAEPADTCRLFSRGLLGRLRPMPGRSALCRLVLACAALAAPFAATARHRPDGRGRHARGRPRPDTSAWTRLSPCASSSWSTRTRSCGRRCTSLRAGGTP